MDRVSQNPLTFDRETLRCNVAFNWSHSSDWLKRKHVRDVTITLATQIMLEWMLPNHGVTE